MTEAYICDGVRTPIGRFAGSLSAVRPDDLAALPISALMERNQAVDWAAVDDVVLGCANQAGEDNRNVARMALLLAGMPESVPAATINRLCGSGMDALGGAARAIKAGEADLMVAGGVGTAPIYPIARSLKQKGNRIITIQGQGRALSHIQPAVTACIPRAAVAREVLPKTLRDMGAKVDIAPAYQTVLPKPKSDAFLKRLQSGDIDVLTFTSSSTVKNFLELTGKSLLKEIKKTRIACIGPITAETAKDAGLTVDILPKEYTVPALLEAIEDYYKP